MLKLKMTYRAGVYLVRIPEHSATIVVLPSGIYVRIDDKLSNYPQLRRFRGVVYVRVASLLSKDEAVVKLAKTRKRFPGIRSVIHYAAPAGSAGMGIQECKFHTVQCGRFCLSTSGKGALPSVQLIRIARSRLHAFRPDLFWTMFSRNLASAERATDREHLRLACRPNGTTDRWSAELAALIDSRPEVTFYDYTAVPRRLAESRSNYHLTMSVKETAQNHDWIRSNIHRHNACAVVDPAIKTRLLRDERFFDADLHDLRTFETDGASGRCGILTPKGQLRGKMTDRGMIFGTKRRLVNAVFGGVK